jgi:hypothetical protein
MTHQKKLGKLLLLLVQVPMQESKLAKLLKKLLQIFMKVTLNLILIQSRGN